MVEGYQIQILTTPHPLLWPHFILLRWQFLTWCIVLSVVVMSKRFESRNSLLFKAKNKIIWMKRVDGNFIRFHDYSQEFKLRKVRLGAVSLFSWFTPSKIGKVKLKIFCFPSIRIYYALRSKSDLIFHHLSNANWLNWMSFPNRVDLAFWYTIWTIVWNGKSFLYEVKGKKCERMGGLFVLLFRCKNIRKLKLQVFCFQNK